MRPIDYIVTGLPRSGTGYMSALLTKLGLQAGHEKSFSHGKQRYEQDTEREWGDVSWLAAPFLSSMPAACQKFYVTRDPIKILNSMLPPKGSLVGDKRRRGPYARFLRHHLDNMEHLDFDDEKERLVYAFVCWDAICRQGCKYEFPVERMTPYTLEEIYRLITGRQVSMELLINELNTTSSTTNHREDCVPWAEEFLATHNSPAVDAVLEIAESRCTEGLAVIL